MIILGIDIAFNHSSFAVFENGDYRLSENYVAEKDDTDEIKYDKFWEFFNDAIVRHEPDKIICEKAFLGPNKRVFGLISELIGMIRSICLNRNIPLVVVSTSSYRSRLGIANHKESALNLVKSLYPEIEIDSNSDIADAICLAKYGSEL